MHRHLHPALIAVVVALATGPAALSAQSRKSCAPADSSFNDFGAVYSACQVDKQAKQRGQLRPNFIPSTGASIPTCLKAVVDVVVDENGDPIASSAKLVRATHSDYGTAVLQAVRNHKWTAATKEGQAVRQLVRIEHGGPVSVKVAGTPGPGTPMQRGPC